MGPVGAMPLWARDAVSDIKSAPSTFSSWDKCMQKAYCKWPVIVGIVVGCIILISIAWCLISCLCCGVQCCKGCASCCTCCCPSGNGGGGHRSKYTDDPSYHHPPPPPSAAYGYQPSPAPPVYRGPQVAQFETPNHNQAKVHDDALPAMPTWQNAATRKIEDTSPHPEDVEMNHLSPSGQMGMVQGPGRQARGGYREIPSSNPMTPQPGYRPGYRGVEQTEQYPPRSPRSPGPYGPGLDTGAGVAAYGQPYRGNSPYQDRSPTARSPPTRAPNFHTPRPFGQPTSPVSPPMEQPHYAPAAVQRRPTYASDSQPPSYVSEVPPQQSYGSNQRRPSYGSGQRQPSYASDQQQALYPSEQRQPTYATYQHQPQPAYNAYSPTIPSSPPPPFEATPLHEVNDAGRPPSLLLPGRKPAPNSWRNV